MKNVFIFLVWPLRKACMSWFPFPYKFCYVTKDEPVEEENVAVADLKAKLEVILSFYFILLNTLLIVDLCMIAVLTGVMWDLIVVLMISHIEHLFICLLAMCMSFLKKCLKVL